MLIGLESTIAEVRNVKKARKILDEYYIEGVEFAIDDKKNMRAIVVEDTWCDLPGLSKLNNCPTATSFQTKIRGVRRW